MKILFFVRDLMVGGSQRQLALLAAGLARRGHDVTVAVLYAGGALEAMLDGSGVRLLSIGKSSRWHVAAPLTRLRRLFVGERPDLVYAFLPTQTTLAALLLPRGLETKLVFGLRAGGMQLDHYDALEALTYRTEAWLSAASRSYHRECSVGSRGCRSPAACRKNGSQSFRTASTPKQCGPTKRRATRCDAPGALQSDRFRDRLRGAA